DPCRQPEVEPAGEGVLEIAAHRAFFKTAHHQEDSAPDHGVFDDGGSTEHGRAESEPMAGSQSTYQRGEGKKSNDQPAEEVNRAPRTSQIVIEDGASLDEGDNRRGGHERDDLKE